MSNYRVVLLESLHGQSAVAAVLPMPAGLSPLAALEALAAHHPGRLLAIEHDCTATADWQRFAWAGGTIRADALREEQERERREREREGQP